MKYLVLLIFMVGSTSMFTQDRNAKASFQVDGVCMMCKDRIEKAGITSKGVKFADWNLETQELQLIFNEKKTDLKTIQGNILDAGHDLDSLKATDEAYAKLDDCCKYRDPKVREDHVSGKID